MWSNTHLIPPESSKMKMKIIHTISWIEHCVCGVSCTIHIECTSTSHCTMSIFFAIQNRWENIQALGIRQSALFSVEIPIHFALENRECLFWHNKTPATNQLHPSIVLSEFNAFQLNNGCRYFRHSSVHVCSVLVHANTLNALNTVFVLSEYHLQNAIRFVICIIYFLILPW